MCTFLFCVRHSSLEYTYIGNTVNIEVASSKKEAKGVEEMVAEEVTIPEKKL